MKILIFDHFLRSKVSRKMHYHYHYYYCCCLNVSNVSSNLYVLNP